jgi:hypothetical protein
MPTWCICWVTTCNSLAGTSDDVIFVAGTAGDGSATPGNR